MSKALVYKLSAQPNYADAGRIWNEAHGGNAISISIGGYETNPAEVFKYNAGTVSTPSYLYGDGTDHPQTTLTPVFDDALVLFKDYDVVVLHCGTNFPSSGDLDMLSLKPDMPWSETTTGVWLNLADVNAGVAAIFQNRIYAPVVYSGADHLTTDGMFTESDGTVVSISTAPHQMRCINSNNTFDGIALYTPPAVGGNWWVMQRHHKYASDGVVRTTIYTSLYDNGNTPMVFTQVATGNIALGLPCISSRFLSPFNIVAGGIYAYDIAAEDWRADMLAQANLWLTAGVDLPKEDTEFTRTKAGAYTQSRAPYISSASLANTYKPLGYIRNGNVFAFNSPAPLFDIAEINIESPDELFRVPQINNNAGIPPIINLNFGGFGSRISGLKVVSRDASDVILSEVSIEAPEEYFPLYDNSIALFFGEQASYGFDAESYYEYSSVSLGYPAIQIAPGVVMPISGYPAIQIAPGVVVPI